MLGLVLMIRKIVGFEFSGSKVVEMKVMMNMVISLIWGRVRVVSRLWMNWLS